GHGCQLLADDLERHLSDAGRAGQAHPLGRNGLPVGAFRMSGQTNAACQAMPSSGRHGRTRRRRFGRAGAAWLARALRRFARDVQGVGAVEFAMVAPVLLAMLLGAVEITRAVAIDKRFTVVTSMVADLVARETQLTGDDV